MPASSSTARLRHIARNASDRLLRPQTLVTAGRLPYDVLQDDGLTSLRHYRPLCTGSIDVNGQSIAVSKTRHKVPLLIVPPLAVNMLVYDLFPERSLVKYLLAQGFDVYLIDWGKPTRRHAHYTLATYVREFMPGLIETVREHSGSQDISLHGWSMGGGLALAYAALSGDRGIRNIITLGTAVDGHANGALGRQYARLGRMLHKARLSWRRVPARWNYAPGWINVIGFKLSDPVSSMKGYVDLFRNLHDRDFVAQHANQGAFIDSLEAYPGGIIRDWMSSVWLENETASGQLTVGDEIASFSNIKSNILCIAGASDNLANQPCCERLLGVVGSKDSEFYLAPGGHIGIVSGSQAPDSVWKKTVEWLGQRSD
jgi:polyhydroxyalkanoate synthase